MPSVQTGIAAHGRLSSGRRWGLAVLMAALLCLGTTVFAQAPSFQDLEESLTCQCGCGLTVHSCNHLQCDSALPLRAEIREQMNLNKSKEAILAHFVERYGEKILSSPTTTGFNLTAWITPFLLVAIGGVFVGLTLVRWRNRSAARPPSTSATAENSPATNEYSETLERELKDFDA